MTREAIARILEGVKSGAVALEDALDSLRDLPFADLAYAKLDLHRELRTGQPEVVYCAGKSEAQLRGILQRLLADGSDVLATRATPEQYAAVRDLSPSLRFDPVSRTMVRCDRPREPTLTTIAVVTAGTSDIPVAEEAAVTAETLGNRVQRVFDVGVAGLHRLLDRLPLIKTARVAVVVAGMEGALPSVIGGLVSAPLIAVPTSVGYGASFSGLAALLAMLNSCAPGIAVMNIDNGFGAGLLASRINHL